MEFSAAAPGKFTTFMIGDTDIETPPTVWTSVGEVIGEISVSAEREQLDVTSHSTEIWSDQISGRVTPISLAFTISTVHEPVQVLWDIFRRVDPLNPGAWFRVIYGSSHRHVFVANVAGLTTVSPLDGAQITTEVTLGVRGEVVYEIND